MNHKRKRPKNRRAGCKLCKPWKVNGVDTSSYDGEKYSDHKRREAGKSEEKTFQQEEAQKPAS